MEQSLTMVLEELILGRTVKHFQRGDLLKGDDFRFASRLGLDLSLGSLTRSSQSGVLGVFCTLA